VLSPSNHEVLNELHFLWEEVSVDGKRENLVSSYLLQIAKENTFYNVVRETEVVEKQEIRITDIDEGQYYLRVRAQKNGKYGRWSKVISFLVRQAEDKTSSYEEQLKIISAPVNGETPPSFVFQFDEEIDTDIMPSIVVKRRLI